MRNSRICWVKLVLLVGFATVNIHIILMLNQNIGLHTCEELGSASDIYNEIHDS